MIFNIQRYSLHDGSGLRSTVFFKGCSLHCPWCSNPESQKHTAELMFESAKCIGCGDCLEASQNDEMIESNGKIQLNAATRQNPDAFRNLCPANALQVVGEIQSAEEICNTVLKDRVFYKRSGGGVTLSGGEPLLQADLCMEIAKGLQRENIHISIETCLHVRWENIEKLIPYVDEFLCDLKHNDPIIFKEHTGGDLNLILSNLEKLSSSGVPIRARIPIIYQFNHNENTIDRILDIIESLKGIYAVDFMPYHSLGMGKYKNLGREYNFPSRIMTNEEIQLYIQKTGLRKIPVTIGG